MGKIMHARKNIYLEIMQFAFHLLDKWEMDQLASHKASL